MNTNKNLKISIIGIGNGGCNIISHLTNKNFSQVELIAIDVNLQLFNEIKSVKQFELKKSLDLGLNSILEDDLSSENFRNIKGNLEENDVVFIVSTLGGETGIYVPSIVAEISREICPIIISIVTTPFNWEGKKREERAILSIEKLKIFCDLLIVIPNEKLLEIISENFDAEKTFELLDDAFFQTIKSLIDKMNMQDNNENIKNILLQKKFVLNYKEHILGTSIFYDSLNKISNFETIEIKLNRNNKK